MNVVLRILLSPLTIFRFIIVILITLLLIPFLIIEDFLSEKRKKEYRFIIVRIWAKSILFVLGFIVDKNKLPSIKKYILMPNHRGYIDIFLMGALSPSAFVAKAELLRWPLIGKALLHCKAILVKREELGSLIGAMQAIDRSIKNGISVTLFPEGTTYEGPGTKIFKSGSFKIAAELKVPVIPCAISFQDPKHAWVGNDTFVPHFFRQMWKPFSKVCIRFGEPLISNDFAALKEQTKQTIDTLLKQLE